MSYSTAPRSLLLAGAFFGAFTVGAVAQQPAASPPAAGAPPAAAAPLPPGSPLIGRPAGNEAAAKLAPVAPPPIPAAADKLPTAKLKVPPGFNIEVYASGIANARSMVEGDKGTVFVGSRLVGNLYAVTNKDGKRTVKTIASGLHRPNGVAFKNGTLYVAELSKISKVEKAEDNLDSPAKLTTIFDKLP
jgi:glucose/arabinose dehydrogenase